MSEETEEGAVAALEYWWELRQYARNTGDIDEWQAVSDEGCQLCEQQMGIVNTANEEGIWLHQEPDSLEEVVVDLSDEGSAFIDFYVDPGPFQSFTEEGLDVDSDGGTREPWHAELRFEDQWVVSEVFYQGEIEESS